MTAYQTEDEQLEKLRTFWQRWGYRLTLSLAVALILFYGWRYWQNRQVAYAAEAALVYQDLLTSSTLPDKNSGKIKQLITQLRTEYHKTPYASLAALIQAKQAVAQEDLELAEQALHWAVSHAQDEQIATIARLRLARVLAATHKLTKALTVLEQVKTAAFQAQAEDARGDIYQAQGKLTLARQSYQQAIANHTNEQARALVQMKLNELASSKLLSQGEKT